MAKENSKAIKKPDRTSCPPGLLVIVDVLERNPDRMDDLVSHEINTRNRELIRTQETKYLLSWHPLNTIRFLLISGGLAFLATWFLGALRDIGHFYKGLFGGEGFKIPFLERGVSTEVFFPTAVLDFLSKLPDYGAEEAFYTALVVIVLLAVLKAVFILFNWKKIEVLHEAEKDLKAELAYLESWKNG